MYNFESVVEKIESIGGKINYSHYGFHSNDKLAKIDVSFDNWWFTSWFDFKNYTAHSPVYWINKKPRGGFQMTVGHHKMSIEVFLELIEEIVTTNSLRIESRKKYINYE